MNRVCLLALCLCFNASLAVSGMTIADPGEDAAKAGAEIDRAFLAEVAEQVRNARANATKDQPPNTKWFSSADQQAIIEWVESTTPATRAKLVAELVKASAEPTPINDGLLALSGDLLQQVLEDQREDLAVQMLASSLGIGWRCPEFSLLQLWYLTGKTQAGVELLLDAHEKATPTRQGEIERTVRRSIEAYLPRDDAMPTGAALIRWARDWYANRKDRLLPNDEYCGDNDCEWTEPVLTDVADFLERRLTIRSKHFSQGGWRLNLAEEGSSLPKSIRDLLTDQESSYPHTLEGFLQAEHAVPRIISIRSIVRCDPEWLLIDTVAQTSEPGQCASSPVNARFVLWLHNFKRLKLLPERRNN